MQDKYLQNKAKFLNGDIKSTKTFFAKNGHIIEHAYCKMLEDDLKGAKQLFLKMKDFDNRALWGYKLCTIFQKKFTEKEINYDEMPSFFQLRNFLEIDLALFIKYNKGSFVEILCAYCDIFTDINIESYKYFARAFYFNNFPEFANFFAQKAKDACYNDAELHYQIAFMEYEKGNFDEAKKYCLSCLHILNDYYPPQKMLNQIAFRQNN